MHWRRIGIERDIAPHILNFGTRWRWVTWVTSRPVFARGKSPSTHWTEGWVDPRPVRILLGKEKFLPLLRIQPCRISIYISSEKKCKMCEKLPFLLIFDPFYTYSLWVYLIILTDKCTRTHTHTHTHTHTVGLLWTTDRPSADTSTWQHATPSGIRTRNPRKRSVADPRLRPRGHWDRLWDTPGR